MLPDNPKLNNITMDGRLFVEKAYKEIIQNKRKPYDMIIIDAYNATSIPFHLTTKEFLDSVKKITSSDGVVVSNIIGAFAGKSSRLLKAMSKTFNTVYPQIYFFPVDGWEDKKDFSETNVILIATMNGQKMDKFMWQNKTDQIIKKGIIKENVNEFVKTLVDDQFLEKEVWFKDAPVLTDDYAPIDTYQNFL
jgi:spermidine synthase